MVKCNLVPICKWDFRYPTGEPLVGGKIYSWKASAHTIPKPLYKNSTCAPGSEYTNPIILGSDGGTDAAVYFADDEDYFLQIKDSADTELFTRDNYNNAKDESHFSEVDFTNYILNPQFRLPLKLKYENDDLPATKTFIAEQGWFFERNNISSNCEIEFVEFSPGQTAVPNNPKYYLSFSCNTVGSGEITKDIGLQIRDINTFSGETIQVGLWGWSSSSSTIQVVFRQDFGLGGSSAVETIRDVPLVNSESEYNVTIDVPTISGKTIGLGSRVEIIFRMPLSQISDVKFVNSQINRGDQLLEFDYQSYETELMRTKAYQLPIPTEDDIFSALVWDSISNEYILENYTGSVLLTFATDSPVGYIKMDGSTKIRLETIGSTAITYDRLYQKWENDSGIGNGNIFGYGSDGFFPSVQNDVILFDNLFGANITNWADVDTGFTIVTERAGNNLNTMIAESDLLYNPASNSNTLRVTNTANGAVTATGAGTSGFTVVTIQSGTASLPEISTVETVTAAGLAGTYFLHSVTLADAYIWFTVDGIGVDPAVPLRLGLKVALFSSDDATEVCTKIIHALRGCEQTRITCTDVTTITGGESFYFYNNADSFYGWLAVDDSGIDPAYSGITGVRIDLLSTDTAAQVATKVAKSVSSYYMVVPDIRGYFLRMWDDGAGIDVEAAKRIDRGDGVYGDVVGTTQIDEFKSHVHNLLLSPTGSTNLHLTRTSGLSRFKDESAMESTGGLETRPVNIYINGFIKF